MVVTTSKVPVDVAFTSALTHRDDTAAVALAPPHRRFASSEGDAWSDDVTGGTALAHDAATAGECGTTPAPMSAVSTGDPGGEPHNATAGDELCTGASPKHADDSDNDDDGGVGAVEEEHAAAAAAPAGSSSASNGAEGGENDGANPGVSGSGASDGDTVRAGASPSLGASAPQDRLAPPADGRLTTERGTNRSAALIVAGR